MNFMIIFCAKYLIYVMLGVFGIYFLTQKRPQQIDMLRFIVLTFPGTLIISYIAGKIYYNPRPFVVGHFQPLVAHAATNGFPSDHTLLGVALAVAILPFNRRLGSVLLVSALVVGAGRVAAGVHHAVDVLGSFLIAGGVSLMVHLLLRKRQKNRLQKENIRVQSMN